MRDEPKFEIKNWNRKSDTVFSLHDGNTKEEMFSVLEEEESKFKSTLSEYDRDCLEKVIFCEFCPAEYEVQWGCEGVFRETLDIAKARYDQELQQYRKDVLQDSLNKIERRKQREIDEANQLEVDIFKHAKQLAYHQDRLTRLREERDRRAQAQAQVQANVVNVNDV